jgi:hypothetical protein
LTAILVSDDDVPALALGPSLTIADLILDGGLALLVGAVTGIYGGSHRCFSIIRRIIRILCSY